LLDWSAWLKAVEHPDALVSGHPPNAEVSDRRYLPRHLKTYAHAPRCSFAIATPPVVESRRGQEPKRLFEIAAVLQPS
jgi:hypothetical protein